MPSLVPLAIATAAGLANVVVAGHNANYFPPKPEGLKVVESKHEEGVKISYKEVCQTSPILILHIPVSI